MININNLVAPDGRVLNVIEGMRYDDFFNDYLKSGNHKKTLGKKYYFHDYANKKAYMFNYILGKAHGAAEVLRTAVYKQNALIKSVDLSVTEKIIKLLKEGIRLMTGLNLTVATPRINDINTAGIASLTNALAPFTALNISLNSPTPPPQPDIKAVRNKALVDLFPRPPTPTPLQAFITYVESSECINNALATYYAQIDVIFNGTRCETVRLSNAISASIANGTAVDANMELVKREFLIAVEYIKKCNDVKTLLNKLEFAINTPC